MQKPKSMDQKLLDKAKKILALAEKGIPGEKDNAQRLLDELFAKYSLTMADLEDNPRTPHKFFGTKRKDELTIAIMCAVTKQSTIMLHKTKRGEHYLAIDCTDAEAAQIQFQIDFYWKALQKEYKAFFHAFCARNKLYNPTESDPDRTYTQAELDYFRKVRQYMSTIKNDTHHTPLGNGNNK